MVVAALGSLGGHPGIVCVMSGIDNFSRRILAWRVNDAFDPGVTAELLVEADAGRHASTPDVMTDGGVENVNGDGVPREYRVRAKPMD